MGQWIIVKGDTQLEVTPVLRFIIRDGKQVLQQLYFEPMDNNLRHSNPDRITRTVRWIDVPVVVLRMKTMTEEQIAEIQWGFASMPEELRRLADAFMELAQIIVDQVMPLIRQVVVFVRRYGFYCWLYERLHSVRMAWWIAWRLPNSWVLKLPMAWVRWR